VKIYEVRHPIYRKGVPWWAREREEGRRGERGVRV